MNEKEIANMCGVSLGQALSGVWTPVLPTAQFRICHQLYFGEETEAKRGSLAYPRKNLNPDILAPTCALNHYFYLSLIKTQAQKKAGVKNGLIFRGPAGGPHQV